VGGVGGSTIAPAKEDLFIFTATCACAYGGGGGGSSSSTTTRRRRKRRSNKV